jgi:putative transposase
MKEELRRGWPGLQGRVAKRQEACILREPVVPALEGEETLEGVQLVTTRRVYDREKHAHFVTFSCYKRRRLLEPDRSKRIAVGVLHRRLERLDGGCAGFAVMPDHVHALVWFREPERLGLLMNRWKDESSTLIKSLYRECFPAYAAAVRADDPVWQARYYGFNVFTREKLEEKLDYMHLNPVRAGLAEKTTDWPWSSARWHLTGRSVGIPIRWPPGFD